MLKLHRIFSYTFPHRVWRIIPVSGNNGLAIEERDESSSMIHLHHYHEGKIHSVQPEKMPWWGTLVAAQPGYFVVRSFGADGQASAQEIQVYDFHDGSICWELPQAILVDEREGYLRLRRNGEENWVEISSGETVGENRIPPEENNPAVFPFRYAEGTKHFETVASFLTGMTGVAPARAIDYREYDNCIVISAFFQQDQKLTNRLMVVNQSGELLLEEVAGENLSGISDNTFFIYGGNLIFVTSRNHFFEYSLTS